MKKTGLSFHKRSIGDRVFDSVNVFLLLLIAAATLYPFLYVVSCSISSPGEVAAGRVFLFPRGFSTTAYGRILEDSLFLRGYLNTLLYVGLGTLLSVSFTTFAAYALSRKRLFGGTFLTFAITFTMLFGGGIIPLYMVIRNLGMINSLWAVVIPGVLAPWNILIARTFLRSIPESMEESAAIQGANDLQILFRIFVPLSKPLLAVLVLFHAVWLWNSFFFPFLFLNDKIKWPLQLFLRQIVIEGTINDAMLLDLGKVLPNQQSTRMATIVLASLPIIMVYPFIQKYFVKGVMIGAIKG